MAGKKARGTALEYSSAPEPTVDENMTTAELVNMIVQLREDKTQLQNGSAFVFQTLKELAVLLGMDDSDAVDVNLMKRRIIDLNHLHRCGHTEEMPRIFGDPGETELVGPCEKRRDHIDKGDPWHRQDNGMEWMWRRDLRTRTIDGQEATFNGA